MIKANWKNQQTKIFSHFIAKKILQIKKKLKIKKREN